MIISCLVGIFCHQLILKKQKTSETSYFMIKLRDVIYKNKEQVLCQLKKPCAAICKHVDLIALN
jgi:hypothetical protein